MSGRPVVEPRELAVVFQDALKAPLPEGQRMTLPRWMDTLKATLEHYLAVQAGLEAKHKDKDPALLQAYTQEKIGLLQQVLNSAVQALAPLQTEMDRERAAIFEKIDLENTASKNFTPGDLLVDWRKKLSSEDLSQIGLNSDSTQLTVREDYKLPSCYGSEEYWYLVEDLEFFINQAKERGDEPSRLHYQAILGAFYGQEWLTAEREKERALADGNMAEVGRCSQSQEKILKEIKEKEEKKEPILGLLQAIQKIQAQEIPEGAAPSPDPLSVLLKNDDGTKSLRLNLHYAVTDNRSPNFVALKDHFKHFKYKKLQAALGDFAHDLNAEKLAAQETRQAEIKRIQATLDEIDGRLRDLEKPSAGAPRAYHAFLNALRAISPDECLGGQEGYSELTALLKYLQALAPLLSQEDALPASAKEEWTVQSVDRNKNRFRWFGWVRKKDVEEDFVPYQKENIHDQMIPVGAIPDGALGRQHTAVDRAILANAATDRLHQRYLMSNLTVLLPEPEPEPEPASEPAPEPAPVVYQNVAAVGAKILRLFDLHVPVGARQDQTSGNFRAKILESVRSFFDTYSTPALFKQNYSRPEKGLRAYLEQWKVYLKDVKQDDLLSKITRFLEELDAAGVTNIFKEPRSAKKTTFSDAHDVEFDGPLVPTSHRVIPGSWGGKQRVKDLTDRGIKDPNRLARSVEGALPYIEDVTREVHGGDSDETDFDKASPVEIFEWRQPQNEQGEALLMNEPQMLVALALGINQYNKAFRQETSDHALAKEMHELASNLANDTTLTSTDFAVFKRSVAQIEKDISPKGSALRALCQRFREEANYLSPETVFSRSQNNAGAQEQEQNLKILKAFKLGLERYLDGRNCAISHNQDGELTSYKFTYDKKKFTAWGAIGFREKITTQNVNAALKMLQQVEKIAATGVVTTASFASIQANFSQVAKRGALRRLINEVSQPSNNLVFANAVGATTGRGNSAVHLQAVDPNAVDLANATPVIA